MSESGAGRALVTGGRGMLAHDLVPALRQAGWAVTALGRPDLDITDPAQCFAAIEGHDLVVNTAAYTAVDAAESDEAAAFATNSVGAANVAQASAVVGARLVHISTDYVFDGTATEPYTVNHPLAPCSAYGRTKAAGEWAARSQHPDAWIVRTAWLYGAGGPNFVSTILRLASQQHMLAVVSDQLGQPTWTVDLADLIVKIVQRAAPPGVYHGTSTGHTSWYDFARTILELTGLDPERVRGISTHESPKPAQRPLWSVLAHDTLLKADIRPIGAWDERLQFFLAESRKS